MFYSTKYASPIGELTIACKDDKLVGLWMDGQKYYGGTIPEEMVERNEVRVLGLAKSWLDRYFAGEKPAIDELPLAPIGTGFRQGV
ncbi:MAG TPA: cysteine methyltransferase, partial [Coriobacteriia bacterium]|nr:cysteine methyltransferase [Coriobacteriia bacterium]